MNKDPNILSGEDVGMILLGKEIQIMNLQRQVVALQQQVDALAAALEEMANSKPAKDKDPNEPIPFPHMKN